MQYHKYRQYSRKVSPPKQGLLQVLLSLFRGPNRARLFGWMFVVMIVISSGVIAPLQQAGALTKTSELSPGDAAKSFAYYKALRHCMNAGSYANSYFFYGAWIQQQDMNQDNASSFEWFSADAATITSLVRVDNTATVGVVNDAKDNGITNCGGAAGKSWIAAAANLWGYNSGPQLLCDLGFTREVKGSSCTGIPSGASNKFIAPDNAPSKLDDFWKSKLGNTSTGVASITANGGEYRLNLDSFQAACLPSSISYTIQEFTSGSLTPTPKTYQASSQGRDGNTNVRLYQDLDIKCSDLANKLKSANSAAVLGYMGYLKIHNGSDSSSNCPPGSSSTAAASTGCGAPSTATSCVIDGVGWAVCSVANFFASVSDSIYGLIANLLHVPKINTDTTSGTNGVYNAWVIMRNLANVAFVIGFLIIIFSQITSLGVSNYGVKKTLPRLVVAAILVNVSFWISAVAVDLSNVLGAGIYNLMSSVKDTMNIGISTNWGNIIGGLLAGGALTVAGTVLTAVSLSAVFAADGGMAILFLALPLVLAAVLAVLIAAFVLIARQALVIILIIISPLAFVALLLPNTEKLFSKWRSALVSMLLMYPIISIVFGGAQIAGLAIMATAKTGDQITALLAIVVGQTVMVLPFFFIPTLIMKFSGDSLKGLVSTLNSKGKGLIGGISGAARKEGQGRFKRSLNTMKYGENAPKGRLGRGVRRFGRSLDQIKDRQGMTDGYLSEERQATTRERLGTSEAYATLAAAGSVTGGQQLASRAQAAAEAEELKKAMQPLLRQISTMDPADKRGLLETEISAGGSRASAALHYSAQIGDTGFLRENLNRGGETGRMTREAINANPNSIIGKAPDLVKGAKAAFGSLKGEDLVQFKPDTASAFVTHMQTLAETASKTSDPQYASDPEFKKNVDEAAASYKTAANGFNSAVQDIQKSPEFQGKFNAEVGTKIQQTIMDITMANPGLTIQHDLHTGIIGIQADGKIR